MSKRLREPDAQSSESVGCGVVCVGELSAEEARKRRRLNVPLLDLSNDKP